MARALVYEPDLVFIDKRTMEDISWDLPTPLYVYDAAGMRASAQRLRAAFSWNPGNRCYFALKALNTPAALKLLLEQGMGLLCVTELELKLAMRVGAQPEQILFSPVGPSEEELRLAMELGVAISLDNEKVLDAILDLGLMAPVPFVLRITLTRSPKSLRRPSQMAMEKFGMNVDTAVGVARRLRELGVTDIGLHAHFQTNVTATGQWALILEQLLGAARKIREHVDIAISSFNIGGGLAASGRLARQEANQEENQPANFENVSASLQQKIESSGDFAGTPVHNCFSRSVTNPYGVLLTRVRYIKPGIRPVLCVDAAISNLLLRGMYQVIYHVSRANDTSTYARRMYDIVGPLQDRNDRIANRISLPQMHVGDLLVVHDAGAYGASMQTHYGCIPRCAEYFYENYSLRCVRPAETEDEFFASYGL